MAIINYTNVAVSVGGGGALYASSASYSFTVPVEGVRSLGQKNAINTIPNGPIEGTLNIDYIVNSNVGKQIFDQIIQNPGAYQGTNVTIGGQNFPEAYLTSHTLSAEANAIVNGSLSFNVFGPGGGTMSQGGGGSAINVPIGHGVQTSVVSEAISFEYNATIEWEPVYILGTAESQGVTFRSAQETVNIRGMNIGKAIQACPEQDSITINIGAICAGGNLSTLSIQNAKVQSSESSVSAGGFVEGSYELIKTY
jgi:hypothetical protein